MSKTDPVQIISTLAMSSLPFTDMLICADAPIMIRMPNGWRAADFAPLSNDEVRFLLTAIEPQWEDLIVAGAINRPLDLTQWRLRINAYLASGGNKVMLSIRRIPSTPPLLINTGLPAAVRLLLDSPRGLLLISGATGAGKSTTMASMVASINETRNAHIVSIEDPIEYVFHPVKSIFSQREVGVDTASFNDGVRDAMRQRPDVIVIGEIRDKETAETALLAGESGHFVIGTVHANSAAGSVQKMLSFFSVDRDAKLQSLASSLVGVISQILLPRADKMGYALSAEILFNHKQQFAKIMGDSEKINSALERKEDGVSQSLAESLCNLVAAGTISKVDAMRAASGSLSLYEKLKGIAP